LVGLVLCLIAAAIIVFGSLVATLPSGDSERSLYIMFGLLETLPGFALGALGISLVRRRTGRPIASTHGAREDGRSS
jgi:hypothetical protein